MGAVAGANVLEGENRNRPSFSSGVFLFCAFGTAMIPLLCTHVFTRLARADFFFAGKSYFFRIRLRRVIGGSYRPSNRTPTGCFEGISLASIAMVLIYVQRSTRYWDDLTGWHTQMCIHGQWKHSQLLEGSHQKPSSDMRTMSTWFVNIPRDRRRVTWL
jgi:hypothetical protein